MRPKKLLAVIRITYFTEVSWEFSSMVHVFINVYNTLFKYVVTVAAECLLFIRANSWSMPKPIREIACGELVMSGLLNSNSGLGKASRCTVWGLRAAGYDPIESDLFPALTCYPLGKMDLPGGAGGVWIIHANAPECDKALFTYDPAGWAGRYRIAYWVWETTVAPRSWARTAKWFHEIWTPSEFSANAIASAFRAANCSDLVCKIKVVKHPQPSIEAVANRLRFDLPNDSFIALTSYDGKSTLERKNPIGTIQAWIEAFPVATSDAVLVIKSVNTFIDLTGTKIIRNYCSLRWDIRFIDYEMEPGLFYELMASVDLFISLSRSEGFGLQIQEAMALKIPVISTRYSAPLEYLNDDCAYLCDSEEITVINGGIHYKTGSWSKPNVLMGAKLIKDAFSSPAERKRKAKLAHEKFLNIRSQCCELDPMVKELCHPTI